MVLNTHAKFGRVLDINKHSNVRNGPCILLNMHEAMPVFTEYCIITRIFHLTLMNLRCPFDRKKKGRHLRLFGCATNIYILLTDT